MRALEESWRIVLVVTRANVPHLTLTLDDLVRHSVSSNVSVLAVDDPVLRTALAEITHPVSYELPTSISPEKYWSTVVSQHTFDTTRTIFLLAGTRLPDSWDARLVATGQRNPQAAAVSPLCVRHPILSAFADSEQTPRLTVNEVDQWLNDYAQGVEFTVPVMLHSCLLLQGKFWQTDQASLVNDEELLQKLRSCGQWVIATDQLYVDDRLVESSVGMLSLPPAIVQAYETRHPLSMIRHALLELSIRSEKPAIEKRCLPVELHVGHSWGGGLSRWIENYIAADTTHNHLVLRSIGDRTAFGQQIALYAGADMGVPLRTWVLAEPILSTAVSQLEYSALLEEVFEAFNVESLVVSSVIGHSMDVLRTALPTTLVLHDFFPFCPALYATFGSPCESCKPDELRLCEISNPHHSYFRTEPTEHFLAVRESFMQSLASNNVWVVAPSASVVRRYETLEPRMRQKEVVVLEHGLPDALVEQFSTLPIRATVKGVERLRIVVLGRATADKGSKLLLQILSQIVEFADIWMLGTGDSGGAFQGIEGVTVIDEYSMTELQAHLTQANPHLGLLLSVVPETFSYTLSELWAAGIPVLATRLGAFEDRISDGENGWLESTDAQCILARLQQIDGDRASLGIITNNVLSQPIRTAGEMVLSYQALQPTLGFIPRARFFLPRRTFQNPYQQAGEQDQTRLYIERTYGVEATYRGVLREFLQYSAQKVGQTERLPRFIRAAVRRLLGLGVRLLS